MHLQHGCLCCCTDRNVGQVFNKNAVQCAMDRGKEKYLNFVLSQECMSALFGITIAWKRDCQSSEGIYSDIIVGN